VRPSAIVAQARPSSAGTLAEQVYEALKHEIHDFRLVPGDRFSEAEIGQRLGMSRTPVREALFKLRNEGFLGVEPKLGWFVLPIEFGRLEQLYDLRVVLELASVARLCATAGLAAGLDELKPVWLVPPRSASKTRAKSVRATSSSTPRWCARPATTRRRACTGT